MVVLYTSRERWIKGYEGRYIVKSNGEILSYRGAWKPVGSKTSDRGYVKVSLTKNGQKRYCNAHRLVLEAFVGKCPDDMQACHNNGNPSDNRVENLRWGTAEENAADRCKHGTTSRGDEHHKSKLSEDDVLEIRRRRKNGETLFVLSQGFGVSIPSIWGIVHREAWKHVGD